MSRVSAPTKGISISGSNVVVTNHNLVAELLNFINISPNLHHHVTRRMVPKYIRGFSPATDVTNQQTGSSFIDLGSLTIDMINNAVFDFKDLAAINQDISRSYVPRDDDLDDGSDDSDDDENINVLLQASLDRILGRTLLNKPKSRQVYTSVAEVLFFTLTRSHLTKSQRHAFSKLINVIYPYTTLEDAAGNAQTNFMQKMMERNKLVNQKNIAVRFAEMIDERRRDYPLLQELADAFEAVQSCKLMKILHQRYIINNNNNNPTTTNVKELYKCCALSFVYCIGHEVTRAAQCMLDALWDEFIAPQHLLNFAANPRVTTEYQHPALPSKVNLQRQLPSSRSSTSTVTNEVVKSDKYDSKIVVDTNTNNNNNNNNIENTSSTIPFRNAFLLEAARCGSGFVNPEFAITHSVIHYLTHHNLCDNDTITKYFSSQQQQQQQQQQTIQCDLTSANTQVLTPNQFDIDAYYPFYDVEAFQPQRNDLTRILRFTPYLMNNSNTNHNNNIISTSLYVPLYLEVAHYIALQYMPCIQGGAQKKLLLTQQGNLHNQQNPNPYINNQRFLSQTVEHTYADVNDELNKQYILTTCNDFINKLDQYCQNYWRVSVAKLPLENLTAPHGPDVQLPSQKPLVINTNNNLSLSLGSGDDDQKLSIQEYYGELAFHGGLKLDWLRTAAGNLDANRDLKFSSILHGICYKLLKFPALPPPNVSVFAEMSNSLLLPHPAALLRQNEDLQQKYNKTILSQTYDEFLTSDSLMSQLAFYSMPCMHTRRVSRYELEDVIQNIPFVYPKGTTYQSILQKMKDVIKQEQEQNNKQLENTVDTNKKSGYQLWTLQNIANVTTNYLNTNALLKKWNNKNTSNDDDETVFQPPSQLASDDLQYTSFNPYDIPYKELTAIAYTGICPKRTFDFLQLNLDSNNNNNQQEQQQLQSNNNNSNDDNNNDINIDNNNTTDINNNDEEEYYISDFTVLGKYNVRGVYKNYGALLLMNKYRQPIAIYVSHLNRFIMNTKENSKLFQYAKFVWRTTFFLYVTIADHLTITHLIEANAAVVSMRTQLSSLNVLNNIFRPFTYHTVHINNTAAISLFNTGGFIQRIWAYDDITMKQIMFDILNTYKITPLPYKIDISMQHETQQNYNYPTNTKTNTNSNSTTMMLKTTTTTQPSPSSVLSLPSPLTLFYNSYKQIDIKYQREMFYIKNYKQLQSNLNNIVEQLKDAKSYINNNVNTNNNDINIIYNSFNITIPSNLIDDDKDNNKNNNNIDNTCNTIDLCKAYDITNKKLKQLKKDILTIQQQEQEDEQMNNTINDNNINNNNNANILPIKLLDVAAIRQSLLLSYINNNNNNQQQELPPSLYQYKDKIPLLQRTYNYTILAPPTTFSSEKQKDKEAENKKENKNQQEQEQKQKQELLLLNCTKINPYWDKTYPYAYDSNRYWSIVFNYITTMYDLLCISLNINDLLNNIEYQKWFNYLLKKCYNYDGEKNNDNENNKENGNIDWNIMFQTTTTTKQDINTINFNDNDDNNNKQNNNQNNQNKNIIIINKLKIITILTQIICNGTAIHEHVGTVSDVILNPAMLGVKLHPINIQEYIPIQNVQEYTTLLLLSTFTGERKLDLLTDSIQFYFNNNKQDNNNNSNILMLLHWYNWLLFKYELLNFIIEVDFRNIYLRDFPLLSFNPRNLEASVGI